MVRLIKLRQVFLYAIIVSLMLTLIACGGGTRRSTTGNVNQNNGGVNNVSDNTVVVVSATNPSTYNWSTLTEGTTVYIDRDYTYSSIPAVYEGFSVLQTANNDKSVTTNPFLTFNIDKSVTVFVAHYQESISRPSWLSSWDVTGDSIITTDRTLNVYSKEFSAGTVALGGNEGAGGSSYVVFINTGTTLYKNPDIPPVGTGSASLSWTPPATNSDGSELTDLAGYIIRFGTSPGSYIFTIAVDDPNASAYTINGLASKTYYFVVSAIDNSGNESIFSNEAQKIIP